MWGGGGGGHLVYAIRLGVCVGGWCACVYVCVSACTETYERVCVCVCARARAARVCARAGGSMSAGCLCFGVRHFQFVLYD